MQETVSPGHHIAVRMGDTVIQAQAHQRASPEFLAAMVAATAQPRRRAETAVGPIVVGSSEQDDVVAYVAESLTDVLKGARGSLGRRTLGLASIGLLGALIVNLKDVLGNDAEQNEEEMLTSPLEKMTARRESPWNCGSGL